MLEKLEKSSFEPYVGEDFKVTAGELELSMKLMEVTAGSEASRIPEGRETFSVIFVAPGGEVLEQQIFEVSHPEMGEMGLFLVPLGPEAAGKGIRYEAIFT